MRLVQLEDNKVEFELNVTPGVALLEECRTVLNGMAALIRDYANHDSWRCAYPDRYPWDPDCPCGLVSALQGLGLPKEWADGYNGPPRVREGA